jgi:choline kinase|tara:strand:+ start:571 stop:1353 length:783 start_codon:yes stop_codon:yes gene_type:complete
MKAIILAAGVGSRMKKYTESLPKGMIKINRKTLIDRQIQILDSVGINKIVIVKGYKSEMINYDRIAYYINENYQNTNMVESLMCASSEYDDDLIITYADLIYTKDLINKLIEAPYMVTVCVDQNWKNYWFHRYGTTETDLETLSINNNVITELGAPRYSSDGIHFRYVGVVKFSLKIIPQIVSLYRKKKNLNEKWVKSGQNFLNGYMTDLLNEMIINGISLNTIMAGNQWIEIDTATDYENLLRDYNTGKIKEYFLGDLE